MKSDVIFTFIFFSRSIFAAPVIIPDSHQTLSFSLPHAIARDTPEHYTRGHIETGPTETIQFEPRHTWHHGYRDIAPERWHVIKDDAEDLACDAARVYSATDSLTDAERVSTENEVRSHYRTRSVNTAQHGSFDDHTVPMVDQKRDLAASRLQFNGIWGCDAIDVDIATSSDQTRGRIGCARSSAKRNIINHALRDIHFPTSEDPSTGERQRNISTSDIANPPNDSSGELYNRDMEIDQHGDLDDHAVPTNEKTSDQHRTKRAPDNALSVNPVFAEKQPHITKRGYWHNRYIANIVDDDDPVFAVAHKRHLTANKLLFTKTDIDYNTPGVRHAKRFETTKKKALDDTKDYKQPFIKPDTECSSLDKHPTKRFETMWRTYHALHKTNDREHIPNRKSVTTGQYHINNLLHEEEKRVSQSLSELDKRSNSPETKALSIESEDYWDGTSAYSSSRERCSSILTVGKTRTTGLSGKFERDKVLGI